MSAEVSTGRAEPAPVHAAIEVLLRMPGLLILGAVIGLTWSAALRAYMVSLAGHASAFSWWGTFGSILFPGALSGALLALAWRRGWQARPSTWFAFAPTPLALVPLLEPGALAALVTTAFGGAAGVVATGLIGGFALGARGALWMRTVCAAVWIALITGFALTPTLVGGLPSTSPESMWLAVLVVGLMAAFSLACAAPFLAKGRDTPG